MAADRFDLAVPADIRFGPGRVAEVPAALAALGATRVLVVTGANPDRAAGVLEQLGTAGIEAQTFAVPGEPDLELIRSGVRAAAGSDGVLGYGGGSALDAAKAIAALTASGTDPLDHLEVVGAGRSLPGPSLPCVAVPTTAGTGSEVTRNAVLSADGVKASLRSAGMLPRVAIVDPDLLAGLPPAVIAASGSDALSQLIEPFLSGRANPVTDALAVEGIARCARALPRAGRAGLADDPQGRADLAIASLFGGLCLANSGLGAVHGFAGAIGARFEAPHGAVCGALLAAVVAVNLDAMRERDPEHPSIARTAAVGALLTAASEQDASPAHRSAADHRATADDAAPWLSRLAGTLAIPGLSTYGLTDDHVPAVVAQARQASSMKANPIELTQEELTAILRTSL